MLVLSEGFEPSSTRLSTVRVCQLRHDSEEFKKRLRLRRLVITLRGLLERLAGDPSLDIHRALQAVTRYVISIASFEGSSHRPVTTRYSAFPFPLTLRAIQKR